MKSIIPALLFAGFALSACASVPPPDTTLSGVVTGRHWSLTEVGGHPISHGPHEAYLELDATSMRYSGSGGCNGMGGAFTLQPGNHIHFSHGMHTMMACQTGMDTESELSGALDKADSYAVAGNTLTLGASGTPLARFEAH